MELSDEATRREERLLATFHAKRGRYLVPKVKSRKITRVPPRKSRRNKGSPAGFVSENVCVGKIDPITKQKIRAGIKLECDKKCYDITTVARFTNRLSPFTRAAFSQADNDKVDAYIRSKKGGKMTKLNSR